MFMVNLELHLFADAAQPFWRKESQELFAFTQDNHDAENKKCSKKKTFWDFWFIYILMTQ